MSIAQFIQMAKIIATLLPVIIDLVASLDAIATQTGTGKDKLALVLDLVRKAFDDLKAIDIPWEKIEPYVKMVVEGAIKLVRR